MAAYGGVIKRMERISALAKTQPQEIRERRAAAEEVLGRLEADIGRAGTYEFPSGPIATTPSGTESATTPSGTESFSLGGGIFKDSAALKAEAQTEIAALKQAEKARPKPTTTTEARQRAADLEKKITAVKDKASLKSPYGNLDKDKALAQVESSSAFRQVSRMMAESEQLLARSGPLYEEMLRSTQLPILEGSATMARENTENIRRALQRGGAARRDGFAAIAKIRAQEQANLARGQALAKAHNEMDLWARNNAKEVINFAHGWATNQAGIRDSYQSAMDSATQLMAQSSLPLMFQAQQKEQEYRDAKSAQSRGKVMRQVTGVIGVAGSVVSIIYGGGAGAGSMLNMANETVEGEKVDTTGYSDKSAAYGAPRTGANYAPSTEANNYYGAGGQG